MSPLDVEAQKVEAFVDMADFRFGFR